jgi:ferredoxin-NADP reductase
LYLKEISKQSSPLFFVRRPIYYDLKLNRFCDYCFYCLEIMFNSLNRIHNPWLRSITAASTSFAIVTMIGAVAMGLSKPETKSAYKLGVYASLLATVGGAVFGRVYRQKPDVKLDRSSTSKLDRTWEDWRNFVVAKKVVESQEITSFYLQPEDGGALPDFKPGQFLTIKLDIPEQSRPVIRTYSLSDYPESRQYYRLSIKREASPPDLDVTPGLASNFMHDRIWEGSVIPAKPPNGKFFIEVPNSIPAVLISNGVGITPMIAMAKACSRQNPNRHIWFLHGAKNSEYHACREEMMEVADVYANLHLYYKYSRPQPEDEGKFYGQGYVDKQFLATSILPEIKKIYGSTDAEYFLCGSPAFMDSLRQGLSELGVPEERVFFESFSKGGKTKNRTDLAANTNNNNLESAEIVFSHSQQTLTWNQGDGTILEFAEANNINPPYSCRAGICLTCMCAIESGEVDYIESPTNQPDRGSVLICISQPKTSRVVLDL